MKRYPLTILDPAELAEFIRDIMGNALVPGAGIAITVDDPADTVTITNTGGGGGGGTPETYEDVLAAITGKVHRWKFDEADGATVADSIGTLPLTLSGTYTRDVPTLTGKGVTFTSGAKAQSTGLGSIPVGGSARCFLVLYRNDGANNKRALVNYGTTGTVNAWFTGFLNDGQNDRLSLAIWGTGDLFWAGSSASNGDWHLTAFGIKTSGGAARSHIYHDGEIATQTTTPNTGSAGNFVVGQVADGTSPFVGTIDDIIVLNQWPGKAKLDRLYRALQAVS